MDIEIPDIEYHYQEMLKTTGVENVDFSGINLIDVPRPNLSYKVYQAQEVRQCVSHPLVDYIKRRGMLRYFSDVADSTRPDATRIDISLHKRNDANIKGLVEYLMKYLQGIGIDQYRLLVQKASAILGSCGGCLWMAGWIFRRIRLNKYGVAIGKDSKME